MPNFISNMITEKKRYKEFKHEVALLPTPYAKTMKAIETYMWNFAKGAGMMDALEEILHMFQEAAAEPVPVTNIIGDDPVEFADNIMAQYPNDLWLVTYQNKLRQAVVEATK